VRFAVVHALTLLACGRIGIEARSADPIDGGDSPDAAITADAAIDAKVACPIGTTEIVIGARPPAKGSVAGCARTRNGQKRAPALRA
jgi:hypothetical protein